MRTKTYSKLTIGGTYKVNPSPRQQGHYWMETQGYSLAKVRDMVRPLVQETGSELGEIYPHRDGQSILYSYTLGEILSETPSGPPHASGEIPGEIQPAKIRAKIFTESS